MISKRWITTEVRNKIAALNDARRIVNVREFVSDFIAEKGEIEGENADFYRTCSSEFVRAIVSRVIAAYDKPSPETDRQFTMDGFEHLQTAYPVVRGGTQFLVPVELMSDDEFDERAALYRKGAAGLESHADEMMLYKASRQSDLAAE